MSYTFVLSLISLISTDILFKEYHRFISVLDLFCCKFLSVVSSFSNISVEFSVKIWTPKQNETTYLFLIASIICLPMAFYNW